MVEALAAPKNGGGYGLELIFFLLENNFHIPYVMVGLGFVYSWFMGGGILSLLVGSVVLPGVLTVAFLVWLVTGSYLQSSPGKQNWEDHIDIVDANLKSEWSGYKGKKIPMESVVEAYLDSKIDFKGDVYEIFLKRNSLFRFCFTMHSVKFYLGTFLYQNLDHSSGGDKDDIKPVYDRGNDFYRFFLGPMMIYTSGIYRSETESLEDAQTRKLDTVCKQMQMKKGGEHLDIGCGWGTLIRHSAKNFNVNSTGVSLAEEQKKWHLERCKEEKVDPKQANFMCMDYREIPSKTYHKQYDYITCLEMAEHVGIKNFQTFLIQVKNMLKDEGLFYLQIAGLRRAWQFEDLVWGVFMGKYIFPAADASCPLGFVVTHLERAGFEVHRVENCGVHYSLTIKQWYDNWVANADDIHKSKYGTTREGKPGGQFWYRLWVVFLAWSAIIAAQGSSTVFMITCHKNHKNDTRSVEADEPTIFCRMARWVGNDPIATQQ